MARYLIQLSYSNEAMANLISNPQDRGAVMRDLNQRLGGKMVSTVDFPDNESIEAPNDSDLCFRRLQGFQDNRSHTHGRSGAIHG